jgi:hypothetical protein
MERRLSAASAVGWGCLIAAAGMLSMSQLKTATPFAWPAGCYILVGVGFALMVPAGSAAAMAEVPEGSSGVGSGLFNACRQIGTATGLAILGSIGTAVILAGWHRQAGSFPPAEHSSESQRTRGLHHRAGRARTEPVRPVELGQLDKHLHARSAHARPEPRAQPDRRRGEQLGTGHGRVERRFVARVSDRVEYLFD